MQHIQNLALFCYKYFVRINFINLTLFLWTSFIYVWFFLAVKKKKYCLKFNHFRLVVLTDMSCNSKCGFIDGGTCMKLDSKLICWKISEQSFNFIALLLDFILI